MALLTLLEPVDEYEAKCLRNSIKVKPMNLHKNNTFFPNLSIFWHFYLLVKPFQGFGTNENVIIQTLCPKEQNELEILKAAYKRCERILKNSISFF